MNEPTLDELFIVMARASCGDTTARVELAPDAAPDHPVTRLAIALNILLDDLGYRQLQAEAYWKDLLQHRTQRLRDFEENVRRRDEFIAVAAHELRTPLTSLRLVLEGIDRKLPEVGADDLVHGVNLAERQGRKLSALVDQLLEVGRTLTEHEISLSRQEFELGMLVREVVELLVPESQRSRSNVTVFANAPVVGLWDRVRLEQVVTNLVGNAIKFGLGNPISIAVSSNDNVARIVIRDQGIGIATDRISRIFNRFERGVPATHFGGLGLGLFIVREIVTAHGGTVRAESVLGEGATFTVELPMGLRRPAAPPGLHLQ